MPERANYRFIEIFVFDYGSLPNILLLFFWSGVTFDLVALDKILLILKSQSINITTIWKNGYNKINKDSKIKQNSTRTLLFSTGKYCDIVCNSSFFCYWSHCHISFDHCNRLLALLLPDDNYASLLVHLNTWMYNTSISVYFRSNQNRSQPLLAGRRPHTYTNLLAILYSIWLLLCVWNGMCNTSQRPSATTSKIIQRGQKERKKK